MSLLDLYKEKRPRTVVFIDPSYEELKQEKVCDENGIYSKKTSYIKTSVEDKNKQFRSSDFMIEALEEVGKMQNIREVKMANYDTGSLAAGVEQFELNLVNQIQQNNEKSAKGVSEA